MGVKVKSKVHQTIEYNIRNGIEKKCLYRHFKYDSLGNEIYSVYINHSVPMIFNQLVTKYYDKKGNVVRKIEKSYRGEYQIVEHDNNFHVSDIKLFDDVTYNNKYDENGLLFEVEENHTREQNEDNQLQLTRKKIYYENHKEIIKPNKIVLHHFDKNNKMMYEIIKKYDFNDKMEEILYNYKQIDHILSKEIRETIKSTYYYNDEGEKVTEKSFFKDDVLKEKKQITKYEELEFTGKDNILTRKNISLYNNENQKVEVKNYRLFNINYNSFVCNPYDNEPKELKLYGGKRFIYEESDIFNIPFFINNLG